MAPVEKVKTIVAALDLETGGETVLARSIQLATAHAARLILLHAIEAEPLSRAALWGRSETHLRKQLKRQALATIEPLLIERGRTRRTAVQVEFGPPHGIITRLAEQQHADLIVVGPGKGRSLKERVLGSTTDRVIRTAHASVLVVRKRSEESYRRVAVAVDFSHQSAIVVREACRLAPEAAVQLIHAIDIPLTFQQAMLRAGTTRVEVQEYRAARANNARDNLFTFVRAVVGAGKVTTRVLEGDSGPVLVRLSRTRAVDLLAVGPHGRSLVRQALLGSVTLRVLKEAGSDVLVAKPN
jgi:nucleotide-binding universal stress UspA family protein